MLRIVPESHLDHGLTAAHQEWILTRNADRDGFFIETVEIPAGLPSLLSGMHGPAEGDVPTSDDEVVFLRRGNRAGESRMIARAPRETRFVTVIAGPHAGEPCVLYTAFGGKPAPREPWDPGLRTDAEKAESVAFWATHALSLE